MKYHISSVDDQVLVIHVISECKDFLVIAIFHLCVVTVQVMRSYGFSRLLIVDYQILLIEIRR